MIAEKNIVLYKLRKDNKCNHHIETLKGFCLSDQNFNWIFNIVIIFIYSLCVCTCIHMYVGEGLRRSEYICGRVFFFLHMGAREQNQVNYHSSWCLKPLSHLAGPWLHFLTLCIEKNKHFENIDVGGVVTYTISNVHLQYCTMSNIQQLHKVSEQEGQQSKSFAIYFNKDTAWDICPLARKHP